MRFTGFSFGSIRVDGVTYDHNLVIDRGKIRKRKKAASRKFRGAYGHTPLSIDEDIPWRCRRLVIGTGADGALPVMRQVGAPRVWWRLDSPQMLWSGWPLSSTVPPPGGTTV